MAASLKVSSRCSCDMMPSTNETPVLAAAIELSSPAGDLREVPRRQRLAMPPMKDRVAVSEDDLA